MSNTEKDMPFHLRPSRYTNPPPKDWEGGKCRCPICGGKNAGRKRNRKLYREYGMVKDEAGRYIDFGTNKKMARKAMRSRMKRELMNLEFDD